MHFLTSMLVSSTMQVMPGLLMHGVAWLASGACNVACITTRIAVDVHAAPQ
jgi:hypothetical protein